MVFACLDHINDFKNDIFSANIKWAKHTPLSATNATLSCVNYTLKS